MSKAIIVHGCKDCPYGVKRKTAMFPAYCMKYDFDMLKLEKTPHPNCKLNDLPTEEDIENMANTLAGTMDYKYDAAMEMADYVLKEITK